MISELYKLMVTSSPDSSAAKLNAWRFDLQEELTMEQWSKACKLDGSKNAAIPLANDSVHYTGKT